ncbi:MAG: hypothetical protein KDB27_31385 [Planctomycetales bacterium]|nr:hypothetical protein [Planctomycetales bacterium]
MLRRPLFIHLVASIVGAVAFGGVFVYLYIETNDLNIFPDDKSYLGATLCLNACANAHAVMYRLIKCLINFAGVLPRSGLVKLSPPMSCWPEEWYKDVQIDARQHPLDLD